MTSQDWSILVPAIVGVLTGITGWLRANAAHKRIDKIQRKP